MSAKRAAPAAAPPPPKRRRPAWAAAAVARFVAGVGAPLVVGAGSARPHRDIKAWIVGLLHPRHAARWARLADDAARAGGAAGAQPGPGGWARGEVARAAAEAEAEAEAARHSVDARGQGRRCLAASADAEDGVDGAAVLARLVVEAVVVRQPGESARIATSNARRQCAREHGRLTLVRLVDVALALRAVRVAPRGGGGGGGGGGEYERAAAFARLSRALRAVRAVSEVDEASEAVEAHVVGPRWWREYGGREAGVVAVVREAVLRASRVVDEGEFVVAPPVRTTHPILAAALLADCDKERAVKLADGACRLREEVVDALRRGDGPLPLKEMRMVLYCEEAVKLGGGGGGGASPVEVMTKLATLFVPADWHKQTAACAATGEERGRFVRPFAERGNFTASTVYGRYLLKADCGDGERYLVTAMDEGDVLAPIEIAALPSRTRPEQLAFLHRAVDRGSSLAPLRLGRLHEEADERVDADRCYQLSITRGSSVAALRLAAMYRAGRGGAARDAVRAARWYAVAKDRGRKENVGVAAQAAAALASLESEGEGAAAADRAAAVRAHCLDALELYGERVGGAAVGASLRAAATAAATAAVDGAAPAAAAPPPVLAAVRAAAAEAAAAATAEAADFAAAFGDAVVLLATTHSDAGERAMAPAWEALLQLVAAGAGGPRAAADALFYLGCMRLDGGDGGAACALFRRAADAGHGLAPNNAGLHLCGRGEYDAALRMFRAGAERGDVSAASNAAFVCLERVGRVDDGAHFLERAVELGSAAAPAKLAALLLAADPGCERARALHRLAVERGCDSETVLAPLRKLLAEAPSPPPAVPA